MAKCIRKKNKKQKTKLIQRWRSPHTSQKRMQRISMQHSIRMPFGMGFLSLPLLSLSIKYSYYYCHGESAQHNGRHNGPSVRPEGLVCETWGLQTIENNRAMRHICHSNAIVRINRFSFNLRNFVFPLRTNFMPAYIIQWRGDEHLPVVALLLSLLSLLLLQLRLIKQTNREATIKYGSCKNK